MEFPPNWLRDGGKTGIILWRLHWMEREEQAMGGILAGADPHLLQWICDTLGRELEIPADLEQITKLEAETFRWGTPSCPDWLTLVPGDWSLIGEMPNLERLEFPSIPDVGMRHSQTVPGPTKFCWAGIRSYSFLLKCRKLKYLDLSQTGFYESWYLENLSQLEYLILPPAEISDFSFLACCGRLEFLDVSRTNFRDCTLLKRLPALKSALLPPRKDLIHYEAADGLTAEVWTREPEPETPGPTPYYLSKRKIPRGENGFYAQIIVADGRRYQGTAITGELIQKLVREIKTGKIHTLTASGDTDLEGVLFTADIRDGWAALALQDFEEDVCCQPCIPEQGAESAPPRLGGQSPVPKSQAVRDLDLAADCIQYYIKSGKLSSKVKWTREG